MRRTAADLVQQRERMRRGGRQDEAQPPYVRGKGGQTLLQALPIAHVRQHLRINIQVCVLRAPFIVNCLIDLLGTAQRG